MRINSACLGSALTLAAILVATPAFADDAPAAPPPEITINGTAALVSEYRFRGVSQTDKNFAVQGSLTVTHSSGFYASVWGSSVDNYVTAAGHSNQEIDIIGGFKKTYSGVTFDIGALYYFYPKSGYAGDNTSTDFIEPYADIAYTYGPVTGKVTVNYAPKQKALALDQGQSGLFEKRDNVYLAGDFSGAIPKTPVSLTAHIGHSFGPSWLATDFNGKKGYTDWGLGASVTYKALSLGVQYVETDADFINLASGKNESKAGVVGSLGVSF